MSMQLETSTGKITTLQTKDNSDGCYVASFVAEQVGVAKLSVSINGLQIRRSPYSIAVQRNYQAVNQPTKIINNNGSMGYPWGIAFGRYGVWAVADHTNHCVYLFDGEDQLVRKFGRNGTSDGEFRSPCGIAFDEDNHIYVVDSSNHRVQKFDIDGNRLLQIGSHGSGDGQLQSPYGITTHNGRIYVGDNGNHRVSVFLYNGQFCMSFGSDHLRSP